MTGMEGYSPERAPEDERTPEEIESEKNSDLVKGALQYLEGEGGKAYGALFELGISRDEFRERVRAFNALPAEERGKGHYDHSRPLTEHKDRFLETTIPPGRTVTIMLHKNGEISIEFLA